MRTRPSLLTNVTLWPTVIVTAEGVTRPFAMVMVAPLGPGLPGIPDCMVELQHGRAAAVSSDDVLLAGLAAQDPQTHVVGRSLLLSYYAVGMRRDAPDLVRFVNGVLEQASRDGSLAASDEHWLGRLDPVPQPAPARYRD